MKKWLWIDQHTVVAANVKLVRHFGGRTGIRDVSLLESALAGPQNLSVYEDPDLYDLAAAYVYGIIQNYPFVDGNKRTSVMSMFAFLANHDTVCSSGDIEIYKAVMELATKEINEADFAAWLRKETKKI